MTEFELINRFFASQPVRRRDVALGIGDDAAVLDVPADRQLVVTTDALVSGVHFLPDVDPVSLGHKALAVNLSDLAAMGADPSWFTLVLVLPGAVEGWLESFCAGLYALARAHNVQLVGGDTTRGPLAIAITAGGYVPRGQALTRSGARPGDRIYVTGTLGNAALALRHRLGRLSLPAGEYSRLSVQLDRPEPRVAAGLALRHVASSAIDISDGLAADLGHILDSSGAGARVRVDDIPLSPEYRSRLKTVGWEPALATGDDYELCFTVPPERLAILEQLPAGLRAHMTCIGEIVSETGLWFVGADGERLKLSGRGYDHFAPGDGP